jgi:hypothetical protein
MTLRPVARSFPDLDMLNPYHNSSTDPNFRAQMTLWAIARSPLIYGADIRGASSARDFALLTNAEAPPPRAVLPSCH